MKENKVTAITIPPYEPALNPAEQAILWVKRRNRMQIALKDKALILFMKNSFDKIINEAAL